MAMVFMQNSRIWLDIYLSYINNYCLIQVSVIFIDYVTYFMQLKENRDLVYLNYVTEVFQYESQRR